MTTNKHGLSRAIPESVKRAVRQRDGFGCVVCGKAIYEYEHLEPEFSDAREHRADGIILLCDSCHRKKGKFLSIQTIKAAAKNPKCNQNGYSFEAFDVGTAHPEIVLGTFVGTNVDTLLEVFGEEILSIKPPLEAGLPFRINARLFDREGRPTLEIIENEWRTSSENWDVEVIGRRITIRKTAGEIVLMLRSEPPKRLVIERISMNHRGINIICQEGKNLSVITSSGAILSSSGAKVDGCKIGIQVRETGLAIGVGGGYLYIESMVFGSTRSPRSNAGHLKQEGVRRNSPCPCRSGKKFKRCHGGFSPRVIG